MCEYFSHLFFLRQCAQYYCGYLEVQAREYFRGISSVLLRNGPSTAIFFGVREPLAHVLQKSNTPVIRLFSDFITGSVLGAAISTMFYPLNTCRMHMQDKIGGPHISIVQVLENVFFLLHCEHTNGGSMADDSVDFITILLTVTGAARDAARTQRQRACLVSRSRPQRRALLHFVGYHQHDV